MTVRDTGDLYQPIETARISAQIVERLSHAIRIGTLSVGDRLPPERGLVELFNVSRVTVRDALRILEARGLIEIRLGATGGAFVTAPPPQVLSEGLTDMLALSSLTAEEITEARLVLELGTIPLVCERADDHDLAELHEICDRSEFSLESGSFDVALSAEFHVRLARAAHNHAIERLVDVFQGPLLASLRQAQALAPRMGDRGVTEHREIVQAVASRNLKRATQVMRTHLERTAARVRGTSD